MDKTLLLKPACLKTLSAVEARPERSNQHEFNGVSQLKTLLGTDRFETTAVFTIRDERVSARAKVTWYDSREEHATRTEHRLYFQTNSVMDRAQEGDNILIGYDPQGQLHCVLIPRGSAGHKLHVDTWQPA